jgi:hypothetical protein
MATLRVHLALIVAGSTLIACSRKAPEPVSTKADTGASTPAAGAIASSSEDGAGEGKLDPNDPKHGTRKLRGLDTPVFVDGVQTAVLRGGEFPQIPQIVLEGGAVRYRVYDYLKAIGVSPERVKSVHFHGNQDRVASVEGFELLKQKDRFQFQFQATTSGLPLQAWDTEGLKNEFVANEIRRVTVYVDKKPAPIHPTKRCHLGPDGECTDAIPYFTGELAKGTRIYVDGHMVGFVKRRAIGDALSMGDTQAGEHKFSVTKLATQMGVDLDGLESVELVAGDDVIARASGDDWKRLSQNIYFTIPKHNHGKVRVHVPAEFQAHEDGVSDHDALVSAVLLYKSTKPTNRDLVAISENTDLSVQLASIDDARGRGER